MRNNFEAAVFQTIRYFSFFKYPPDFEEIYTFLKKKVSKRRLTSILEKMTKENLIIQSNCFLSSSRRRSGSNYIDSRWSLPRTMMRGGDDREEKLYTLPQYTTRSPAGKFQIDEYKEKHRISEAKIKKIHTFLKILSWFPQIQLVGLSGTVAMMNAKNTDDVDLFIISARNRLWTARIIALFIAELLRLRRKAGELKARDKTCLNLFFDESNLQIPKYKQTEYVAHEVLQMKPLVQKEDVYMRFIDANSWVFDIFPNAQKDFHRLIADFHRYPRKSANNPCISLIDIIEFMLKKLQLISIRKHQTNEIVTDTQLWFFPEDFEKKLYGLSRD